MKLELYFYYTLIQNLYALYLRLFKSLNGQLKVAKIGNILWDVKNIELCVSLCHRLAPHCDENGVFMKF
jgi:hypothetical protein